MTPGIRTVSRSPHPAESSLEDSEDRMGLGCTPGDRSGCGTSGTRGRTNPGLPAPGVGGGRDSVSLSRELLVAASHTLGNCPKSR